MSGGLVVDSVLRIAVLLGTGTVAGIFVAVLASVGPALAEMRPAMYVQVHQLLGKGYHPMMPILVNVTMLAEIALAVLTAGAGFKVLYAVNVALLLGVQFVSHLGNVPINRALSTPDAAGGAGWQDPRPRWLSWHRLRTALACAALLGTSVVTVVGT